MSENLPRRMRRFRSREAMRRLRRETVLLPGDFIEPIFVVEDKGAAGPISSMPGVERVSVDGVARVVDRALEAKLAGVILFGIPRSKDENGSGAWVEDGPVPRALRLIKGWTDELAVIADVCLCEYTSHGHCGLLSGGTVDNDATLEALQRTATCYADAGADIVAPSGMMDGMVAAIRDALDGGGHPNIAILSYAAKYASIFYGPFRDAAECAPQSGDRRGYQMDPANAREAIAEVSLDLDEGADAVMVKPAMPCLDVIAAVREEAAEVPVFAYQVSGEYAMIQAAAAAGAFDERAAALESLLAIKRAGADKIITYFAQSAAQWLAR